MAQQERPPLAQRLELVPHPEGGGYRQTWRAPVSFAPPGYGGERSAATAAPRRYAAGTGQLRSGARLRLRRLPDGRPRAKL